jgi:membrane protease subunit (stomatin/prohibitin family)
MYIEAGIGIFGQQAIPTLITMFVAWPVIITQTWGMVHTAILDDKVIQVAEASISRNYSHQNIPDDTTFQNFKFCTNCGRAIAGGAQFCFECGFKF